MKITTMATRTSFGSWVGNDGGAAFARAVMVRSGNGFTCA